MSNRGLAQIIPESVSAVTATPSIELGTEKWVGGNKYTYVYNASTSTAAVNYGVVYSAMSGYSVTVSSVAMYDRAAGLVVNNDIGVHEYGWVMTKGFGPCKADTTTVPGLRVYLGDDGVWSNNGTDGTDTGWTGIFAGVAVGDNADATGTFTAFLNCG